MINFLPVPVSPNCRWPANPISIQRLFPPNVTTVHKKTIVSAFKALVPGRRQKHRKSQTKVTTKSAELAPPKAEPSAAVEEEGMQLQNEQPANDAIAVAGNGSQQAQNPAPAAAGGRFKAVLFDMGGVLVKYKNPCAYEDLVKKARTNKTIAKCLQDFDLGLKSAEELRDLFAELMPNMPRCNVEQVAQVENTAILDECLLAIVPQLREHGLKVGIVTNNGFWSNQRQRTVMLSDVSLFDLVIESCKLGLRKPSPQIFLKAAELLGVQPDQCIFIDDTEGHCRGAESKQKEEGKTKKVHPPPTPLKRRVTFSNLNNVVNKENRSAEVQQLKKKSTEEEKPIANSTNGTSGGPSIAVAQLKGCFDEWMKEKDGNMDPGESNSELEPAWESFEEKTPEYRATTSAGLAKYQRHPRTPSFAPAAETTTSEQHSSLPNPRGAPFDYRCIDDDYSEDDEW